MSGDALPWVTEVIKAGQWAVIERSDTIDRAQGAVDGSRTNWRPGPVRVRNERTGETHYRKDGVWYRARTDGEPAEPVAYGWQKRKDIND